MVRPGGLLDDPQPRQGRNRSELAGRGPVGVESGAGVGCKALGHQPSTWREVVTGYTGEQRRVSKVNRCDDVVRASALGGQTPIEVRLDKPDSCRHLWAFGIGEGPGLRKPDPADVDALHLQAGPRQENGRLSFPAGQVEGPP
jgi:hypothetical protein